MADQLAETEAHLAKLHTAKKIVVSNIVELQNKIDSGKEMLLDHPRDESLRREVSEDNRRWRSELQGLEAKRAEIDSLILRFMDEVKRLRLRNN